ncbi:MAG TPA: ATPase domain-containing protein, partial [Syntrophorhabdaceae bacterium]|nr:ATPase domain-containing protein [Syntrophorhabdaceae bacterium]
MAYVTAVKLKLKGGYHEETYETKQDGHTTTCDKAPAEHHPRIYMEVTMAVVQDETCVEIAKSITGIDGLDQITGGGLPKKGATLLAGNAGCGKTLLAMQFLVNGALLENEPGVFVALEESNEEL